ncbi:hypothetical protein [Sphingomonas profundi]|uniref:hypothetical protein n=1 Tax=Alterirhizorhabdus profundi TaxID=2681549 RepID=UPI0012E7ECC3|nr:hypothetical protein [Sphingomonas profundi]
MIEGAALLYSLTTAFVLTSAERNRKAARPHARRIVYAGWMLMGASFTGAGLLGITAIRHALV